MKSLKTMLPLATLGLFAALPLTASASPEEPGVYLGGGIGYERINSENFPDDSDELKDERTAYKGLFGFRLNPIISLEGQFIDFGDAVDGPLNVEATGWTAGVVLNLPINEFISPYAKAGYLFWDSKLSVDGFGGGKFKDDGSDPFYGFGLKLGLSERLDLRVEYERLKLDDTDVDLASVNLQFNF